MTLRFQTRLILFSTVTFAVLLTALSLRVVPSAGPTARSRCHAPISIELTTGLHGYLRFERGVPSIAFDEKDADQVAFVHDATRYYQIYDGADGSLLVESQGFEPLGLHFTPDEVRGFLNDPATVRHPDRVRPPANLEQPDLTLLGRTIPAPGRGPLCIRWTMR